MHPTTKFKDGVVRVVPELTESERDLQALSAELRKLEGEYTMFFAGRLPRPPWETRGRVDQLFKRWDRRPVETLVTRFRLQTLQSREEGRPAPGARRRIWNPHARRDLISCTSQPFAIRSASRRSCTSCTTR